MWEYVVGGFVAAMVVPAVVQVGSKAIWQAVRPKVTGNLGESMVDGCLRKFKGKEFARLRDVMLPTRNGTSQIDNLLVSRQGIFVIEVKNYAGSVYGDESSSKWVHYPPRGSNTSREFYNPIWQNNGHIRALKALLGRSFPNALYHNVVVFSDNCKVPKLPGVVKMSELKSFLKELTKGEPVLSEKDVSVIKECIENSNIKGRGQRSQHVAYAKEAANKAKEREVAEVRRLRAEANKDMAMKVQNLYSDGRLGVDDVIADAEKATVSLSESSTKSSEKDITADRQER